MPQTSQNMTRIKGPGCPKGYNKHIMKKEAQITPTITAVIAKNTVVNALTVTVATATFRLRTARSANFPSWDRPFK
jgi:hypothetical protein